MGSAGWTREESHEHGNDAWIRFEFECAENPLNSEADLDENFANFE